MTDKVELEIEKALVDRLGMLIRDEESIKKLALAALTEWADWCKGDHRPISISELETHRIYTIYKEIWTDKYPTAEHLGDKLELPMGRARYIIQGLAYQYPSFMHKRERRVHILAIVDALGQAEWVREQGGYYKVTIDQSCRPLMDKEIETLRSREVLKVPVTGKAGSQGRVVYEPSRDYHQKLSEHFEKLLSQETENKE